MNINIDIIENIIHKIHSDIEVKNITAKENGYLIEIGYDYRNTGKKITYQDYTNNRAWRKHRVDSISRSQYLQGVQLYRHNRINTICK